MRDIRPHEPPQAKPDPAPRPRGARVWGATKRRAAAASLAGLLALATLLAAVGTIVASVRGASFGFGLPFGDLAATVSDVYGRFRGVAGSTVRLAATARDLVALLPDLAEGRRGSDLVALLERAEGDLVALGSSRVAEGLGARASDLARGVGAVRSWLVAEEERTVAVVFGNSAEMRAGGGFIGSYAEVRLREGAVVSTVVRDINDADRGSGDRTKPPVQLEPVADRWRAADANWFLSGPDSGEAFLALLNRSPLYRDDQVDAAIFVSPRLVSNLLALTGPVEAGGIKVDSENFLRSIQGEVQEGLAADAESPKQVLADLVPAFSSSLIEAANSSPLETLGVLTGALAKRDLVLHVSDDSFQGVLESLNLVGSLYPTGGRFVGGYVAVAPSTIGGDKTDAVTAQFVSVREQLLPSGLVETSVAVERTHAGRDDDPWWYQEEHRSYVKVYAPEGATPTGASGIWQRDYPRASYSSEFSAYGPLAEVEATLQRVAGIAGVDTFAETGKRVFGFWQRTPRGSGTVASVSYAREFPAPLSDGATYTFVLERQPGSTSSYRVELFAPPGLVWEETGTTRYVFESEDPDGRTVLPLRLVSGS